MFGLAIIAAQVRTTIRFRQNRRLLLDDIFVIFACMCLVSAAVIFFKSVPTIYLVEAFLIDPPSVVVPSNFSQQALWDQKSSYSIEALLYGAAFSIKASFLCFFRGLTDRIYWLTIYWRVVVGITMASFAFCIIAEFTACPHFGPTAGE